MAMQARPVPRLAFGDADDEAAGSFDRRTGAAPLVIGRRHDRIDAPRRYLLHCARRNPVRIEVLTLVGLQLVEPGDAAFHLGGRERFGCHVLLHQYKIKANGYPNHDALALAAALPDLLEFLKRAQIVPPWPILCVLRPTRPPRLSHIN